MNSRDLVVGSSGVLIGMLAGGHIRPLVILGVTYLISIGIARIGVSYILMPKGRPIQRDLLDLFEFPREWADDDISITYNIWYNRVTVQRSFCTKIVTDTDQIEKVVRNRITMLLNWDVLFHYRPLTIKFE